MKFQLNDRVQYIGKNPKYIGKSGTIIASKEFPKTVPDIVTGNDLLPVNNSDYTIKVTYKGRFLFIMNVSEEEIELV